MFGQPAALEAATAAGGGGPAGGSSSDGRTAGAQAQQQQQPGASSEPQPVAEPPEQQQQQGSPGTHSSAGPWQLLCSVPQAHAADVNCVAWHPTDNSLLASAGDDGVVKLWRLHSPQQQLG